MHDHRNGGPPSRLPNPYSLEYHAQKVVLVELVVTPPSEGDPLDELLERLPLPRHSVEPAVAALELAGLALREGHIARASAPALYFEHLWPVML
ncbi:MAG: hypothetical protein H0V26_04805 [Solirubrobacterales bacterium]|nr:hypothetical protein [Solirubrobacterales bacterium]